MSTWISERIRASVLLRVFRLRAAISGAALLALAGCEEGIEGFNFLDPAAPSAEETAKALPREVRLPGGAVVVRGPGGYCPVPEATKRGTGNVYVLLASCAAIAEGAKGPSLPALLSVTVALDESGPAASVSPSLLQAAAGGAPMLNARQGGGLTLVHLGRGGDALLPGGDPRHWRGAFEVNGRLVLFAVYAADGSALAGELGRDLALSLVEAVRKASPQRGTPGGVPVSGNNDPQSLSLLIEGLFR